MEVYLKEMNFGIGFEQREPVAVFFLKNWVQVGLRRGKQEISLSVRQNFRS